jgi:flagellin
MALVINTNSASNFAANSLNRSQKALDTAQARLSSGLRINSAKDDATGLALSMTTDSKIRAATMQARNANDAISLAQTADGYLEQIATNTQRLYEIWTQIGNTLFQAGTAESTALLAENARIDGLVIASAQVVVDTEAGVAGGTGGTFTAAAVGDLASVANFNTRIAAIASARAAFGADMATLDSAVASLNTAVVNLKASYSRTMDADFSVETIAMTTNNILQEAGTAMLAQANQNPNKVMSLLR